MSATATAPAMQRKEFRADVPFTKSAENADTGDLELVGYASTWVQDRDGDYVDPHAFDDSLKAYMDKNPIMLWQHNMRQPVGVFTEAETDDNGLHVRGIFHKPDPAEEGWKQTAYHDVKRGTVKTFSIGGFFSYDIENLGEDDERWIIREVELLEISVVSIPSNPDSIFEAAVKAMKSDDGVQAGHRLTDKAFSQMLQLLGMEELTDPDLVEKSEDERRDRYGALAALFTRVKARQAPDYDAYRSLTEGELDPDTDPLSVLKAVNDLLAVLYGAPSTGIEEKAGRVLSAANAERLRAARGLLDDILAEADTESTEAEEVVAA